MLKHEYIDYGYFGRCLKIENESIEALVTVDIGPRVISLKCKGMENIMGEDTNAYSTKDGGDFEKLFGNRKWYLYGGHRIWISPEDDPKSYYPDNDPVDVKIEGCKYTFTPPEQSEIRIREILTMEFDETKGEIKVTNTVRNTGSDIKNIAAWAVTVVDKGSLAILPQCEKPTGLLPNRTYTIWPYSDMQDDRLYFGNKYITIQQQSDCKDAFKLGFNDDKGYLAMVNKGQLFVKRFGYEEGAQYPDNGCSCECYTNFFMMEIESLSKIHSLGKNDEINHVEFWSIKPCDADFDRKNEQSIAEFIEKNV